MLGHQRPGEGDDHRITRCLAEPLGAHGQVADPLRSVRARRADAGDVVYTGTPAGVGAVGPGAVVRGEIDGLDPVELTVGQPE